MRIVLGLTGLFGLLLIGCTNDPIYLPSPQGIAAGEPGMDGPSEARASIQIPVNTETMEDAADRATRQALLGAAPEIPYVAVGDLEVSVEWLIKNNDPAMPGNARIQLNGANQFFEYDPTLVVLSSDDEAPPSPGLAGDIPLDIPAGGTLSGVFREDELREASIDLDMITRANVNPFRATLVVDKNRTEFSEMNPLTYDDDGEPLPQTAPGLVVPRQAMAQLLRIDLVFKPDRPMVLEYTVRVRDVRGEIVHELALAAFTDPVGMNELQPFMPAPFATAPPVPMP
ncbi:MAG: hypothetical protein H0T42_09460 [Deltaproteobacteria bacterium]|nr:hypothetical protein [Deltaproteobacteria bacterium]